MNATAADYERLARTYLAATGQNPDDWEDECIDEDNDLVVSTRETLDNFLDSSRQWNEASTVVRFDGALYWEQMQARKGDRRESLTVVDCGDFRLTYKL